MPEKLTSYYLRISERGGGGGGTLFWVSEMRGVNLYLGYKLAGVLPTIHKCDVGRS